MKRVVILAAGTSQRLYPLTKSIPKCLLTIGNAKPNPMKRKSILECILHWLEKFDADEVLIITGHGALQIEAVIASKKYSMPIKCLFNPFYAQYNNGYSLWLAREYFKDGFILYNSDVVVPAELISDVLNSDQTNFLVIDEKRELGEEEMKVKIQDNRIVAISKTLDPKISDGEYIGIAKFSNDCCKALANELESLVIKRETQSFYEAALENLLSYYRLNKFGINGSPWIEIDNFTDLKSAREKIIPQITW